MMSFLRLSCFLLAMTTLTCLAACAPAQEGPTVPEIRISGTWEIGASKTKGF